MVNDTFTRFTGYSREQVIGHTALELGIWGDPKQRAAFVEALRSRGHGGRLAAGVRVAHRRAIPAAAVGRTVRARGPALPGPQRTRHLGVERTRLAHEAVLQNASLGIAFTREMVFVQANPALEQMLGRDRGSLTGQSGRVVWRSDALSTAQVGALINAAPRSR